jgi:hypothetical protein
LPGEAFGSLEDVIVDFQGSAHGESIYASDVAASNADQSDQRDPSQQIVFYRKKLGWQDSNLRVAGSLAVRWRC